MLLALWLIQTALSGFDVRLVRNVLIVNVLRNKIISEGTETQVYDFTSVQITILGIHGPPKPGIICVGMQNATENLTGSHWLESYGLE